MTAFEQKMTDLIKNDRYGHKWPICPKVTDLTKNDRLDKNWPFLIKNGDIRVRKFSIILFSDIRPLLRTKKCPLKMMILHQLLYQVYNHDIDRGFRLRKFWTSLSYHTVAAVRPHGYNHLPVRLLSNWKNIFAWICWMVIFGLKCSCFEIFRNFLKFYRVKRRIYSRIISNNIVLIAPRALF